MFSVGIFRYIAPRFDDYSRTRSPVVLWNMMYRLSLLFALMAFPMLAAEPKPLKLLFLGDKGHHKPEDRYRQLAAAMTARKIDVIYTDKADSLSAKTLNAYDGLIVYANIDNITPEQEAALLDYVAAGKGFIPLHCASFCFRNSKKYVELVGAQFQRHGTGTFRVGPAVKDHPITKGFDGFESWDETYTHTMHNEKDRIVLEYREEGKTKEPWTWVRTHGKGRVFYTAWGHDERTWGHAGFNNLLERGIRWACADDPASVPSFVDKPVMVGPSKTVQPFEYVQDAKIPFYPPNQRSGIKNEPPRGMQKPLSPTESMKHYQHPADFELKLFASEPNFGGKLIAMNWDERGRLWVCVTVDYPNEMQREGQGRDKIVICEDTDGDFVADKFTVFAEKLSIPTSLTFAYGGVIIHQAPHTLFLRDKDGDDKADERTVLFSGWGTYDTHAGPSNLRYGLDGWYYGMVGYSGFNGTVAGEAHRFSQGFYRFKVTQGDNGQVKVTKLEFLRGTNNNSWGVGISEEGLLFGSTANGCPSVYLPIPNRYYEKVRGWSSSVLQNIANSNRMYPITEKVRQVDWHGGFTAAAGHALYTARNYPQYYWNRTAFVTEPTGHLAATMVLQENGTDFTARNGWNLVAGADEWISPIMAEVGPDGNVWVIDWYNYIVQHNPTPVGFRNGKGNAYETELRDKKHGRVYRVVAKEAKGTTLTLKGADRAKLVDTLTNNNMFWRLHAQRLLLEGNAKDAVPALANLLQDPKVDAIGLNVGAVHAIYTIAALGQQGTDDGMKAIQVGLKHASAAVRRAAVLAISSDTVGKVNAESLLNDPNMQVRLAALLALAEQPNNKEAADKIVAALLVSDNLNDRWLPDALTTAASTHDIALLATIANKKLAPKALSIVGIVAEHLARRAPEKGLDTLIAALGTADPAVAETIVTALGKGWPKGKPYMVNDDTEKALATLMTKLSGGSKAQLVKLAATWGSKAFEKYATEIIKGLQDTLNDEKASDAARVDAAKQLVIFRSQELAVVEAILDAVTPRAAPSLGVGFLEAVGNSNVPELGMSITKRYGKWPPSARAAAVRVLLARTESTRAFLDAAEKGIIPIAELALDEKQALASHNDRQIASRAKALIAKGGGLPDADRQKVIEELLPITKKSGNATAGKEMFKKHCAACHQHGGEGTKIGPDLTGMAVHPKEELLTHIIDPSRSVEGNFRLYRLLTDDAKTLNGMLVSETRTSIELVDSQAKKHVILRENIESLTATTKSLMPEGFEKQMKVEELTDLLEFLTKRGKYLPIPLDKVTTIVSTKGMFYSETAPEQRLIFADYKPKVFDNVPFLLVDPQEDKVKNVIMLHSANGPISDKMPKAVTLPVNAPAKTIHMLGGVSGWGFPYGPKGTVSLKVRLTYDDGKTEDHDLKNGEHFADYIRKVEVPNSKHAYDLRGRQVRYLSIHPQRPNLIKQIDFLKGTDTTAPIVVAVTIEGNEVKE